MNSFSTPGRGGVLAFTGGYMMLALLRAFAVQNWEFVGYLVVMATVIVCLTAVDRRCRLTAGLLWTFSIWGLLHMAGGLVPIPGGWFTEGVHPVLYNWWLARGFLRYDQIVHAYGFGITTWLIWHIVSTAFRLPSGEALEPSLGVLSLCIAASMGLGAFNEVVEFMMTLIIPDTNVGDYSNVGWDLVANLTGGLFCAACIKWKRLAIQRKPSMLLIGGA